MQGIHWIIRNEEQRNNLIQKIMAQHTPFSAKLAEPSSPKTTQQIRYAHSLCNALAAYKQASPEAAKRDCKVAFGVVTVCTSLVTGDRSARLKSFADYTKGEMEAFITQMEVYLAQENIPFTHSRELKS